MVSRKQAPRREVVDIQRVGDWGVVQYLHKLTCGHTEPRKRPSPATHISCMFCLHEQERPAPKGTTVIPVLEFDTFDSVATAEVQESALKAKIAARLGVSQDAVVIHRQWVSITLTMEEATRL